MGILDNSMLDKLEKKIEPSKKIKKLCDSYEVDWQEFDWEHDIIPNLKDYSSEKVFIQDFLLPKIKEKSQKSHIEVLAGVKPTKQELEFITQERESKELLERQEKTEKEYQDILSQIKINPSPNIDKFTYQLREWVKLVLSDNTQKHSIFILGSAGLGKTFTIKKVLREFLTPEEMTKVIFKGHLTPLSYYNSLYDNPDGVFFWDDVSGLQNNATGISLLKDSTESEDKRLVCYNSTSGKLEHRTTKFFFGGKQIFCMNTYPRSKDFEPILSRIRPIWFSPNYNEILQMMYEVIKEDFNDIDLRQKIKIVEYIERNTNEATENFDLRLLRDMIDLYRYCEGINEKFKEMSNSLIKCSSSRELVLELSKTNKPIKEQEQEWKERTKMSRASFYLYREEMGLCRGYSK